MTPLSKRALLLSLTGLFLGLYTPTPTSQWFQAPQSSLGPGLDIGTGLVHASFWTLDGMLDD